MITQSNKRIILKCSLSKKKREKQNYAKIHNWSKLMLNAPILFKGAKKIIVDKQCGNIYIFFKGAHLSLHYLYRTKSGCKCWFKQRQLNNKTRKNKQSNASNMHYKITEDKEHPIYIPIFVKREKFTYDNKVEIPSYHKKWLEWSIDKLNTYTSTKVNTI